MQFTCALQEKQHWKSCLYYGPTMHENMYIGNRSLLGKRNLMMNNRTIAVVNPLFLSTTRGQPSPLGKSRLLSGFSCPENWPSTLCLKEPRLSPSTPPPSRSFLAKNQAPLGATNFSQNQKLNKPFHYFNTTIKDKQTTKHTQPWPRSYEIVDALTISAPSNAPIISKMITYYAIYYCCCLFIFLLFVKKKKCSLPIYFSSHMYTCIFFLLHSSTTSFCCILVATSFKSTFSVVHLQINLPSS